VLVLCYGIVTLHQRLIFGKPSGHVHASSEKLNRESYRTPYFEFFKRLSRQRSPFLPIHTPVEFFIMKPPRRNSQDPDANGKCLENRKLRLGLHKSCEVQWTTRWTTFGIHPDVSGIRRCSYKAAKTLGGVADLPAFHAGNPETLRVRG